MPKNGKQVVLAQAEHFNVLDDDHFVIIHGEQGALQKRLGIFLVALGEKLHRLVDPFRRGRKAFALGILAQADQHFVNQVFKRGTGKGRCFFGPFERSWFHKVAGFLPCKTLIG